MQFKPRRFIPLILSAVLALPALLAAQEPVTITGKVTSDAGQPLGQVEVAVPSLGLGALSKDDGRYTLVVPGARVTGQTVSIVGRRLGYKSQTAQITLTSGGVTHDFVLAANPLQLGEVVVTGAGTTNAAEKLGTVRSTVSSDLIVKANETNVTEALAAKAPNVTVVQQSGDPGAGSFINIRGISSFLGSNQPLFVVDGVPVDNSTYSTSNFNAPDDAGGTITPFGQTEGTVSTNRAADINPNDIESVEILKGPSASAIYGARAAAGVILITTKSGHAGPTHFTLRSSTSFNDINNVYPLQTTYGQGLFFVHADTSVGGDCDTPGNGVCARSWAPLAAGATTFDHSNELYRGGRTLSNGMTVSGGNDRTTFYLSGDNTYDQGVIVGPNNYNSRTAIRFKGAHRVADPIRIGADLSYVDTRAKYIQRGNNTNGIQLGDLRTPPEFNNQPFDVNGQQRAFRFPHPDPTTALADRTFDNPMWVTFEQQNQSQVSRIYGNVNAEYFPLNWLKFNYTLGADYANDERLEGCPVSSASPCTEGRVIEGKIVTYQINQNVVGTATYTVNPNVNGSLTLGSELNSRNVRQLGTVGRTLVAPSPFKLSNTVTQDLPIDAENVIHSVSWFGQATFDIYHQLYLTGAIRNDASSTFDADHLRAWFPKASAAWEFTKAIGEQSWLSFGKARVAYGEAGNEPLPYLTSQTYSSGILGGISQGTGNTPSQNGIGGLASNLLKAAQVLKPERSKEFEAGADLGFFKDRADASVTYYHKRSEDLVLLAPLSPSTGFFQAASNAATVENKGWEVSLNVRPVQTADYGWEVGFQWARNRSKVLDVGQPIPASCTETSVGSCPFIPVGANFITQVAMVGQPFGVEYGSGFLRCGVSSGTTPVPIDAAGNGGTLAQACGSAPTGALYIGPNGFPQQDPDPRIIMNPNYNWTGNVRTSFRYRKVQVSGLLDIRDGGQIWNGTRGALWSYGTRQETQDRAFCLTNTACAGHEKVFGQNGWYTGPVAGPGQGKAVPIGYNWYNRIAACPFIGIDEPCIEDAGFVKLREVSVTYTIDAPWVPRTVGFSSIDLRLSGRNLATWTNYGGFDPESNLGGPIDAAAGNSGVDYFNNPQTRSFAISIILNH